MGKCDDTRARGWRELAVELIDRSENCKLHAYPDPASGGEPWTVGWGSTGPGIGPHTVWTQAQADADRDRRIDEINTSVTRAVRVRITAGQRAALVDFAYNLGVGALFGSTLLELLNAGDYAGAADQFGRWVHASGKVMRGLVKRRAAEAQLFRAEMT